MIRESVSPHPSKIIKRLAYFIFEHAWNIKSAQWKNSPGQIQGVPPLVFFGSFRKLEFTLHYVCPGLCSMCHKTTFGLFQ